jgi:D-alanyl-lipoteichoic acid acyltransferase DltB (MBOAT superfamily)
VTPQFSAFDYFADLFALCLVLLPAYYLLPWAWARRVLLTVSGAYLLFLIAPRLALFYAGFWIVVALMQRVVAWAGERRRGGYVLAFCIVATLAALVVWKLFPADFILWFNSFLDARLWQVSSYVGSIDAIRSIILPLGLSFASFRAVDLLVQSYLGTVGPLPVGDVLFYGFFPPVQMIGPVIEYSEIEKASHATARLQLDDYRAAFTQIVVGLVKVFVLAVPLASSADLFTVYRWNSPWKLWIELIMYAWFFYLNFSGYSDLAIGAARLFGFKLKPNFSRPYTRPNPQSFWNSWNMSLTRFAQRNVFVPLGGFRQRSQYLAITATMMVIALWHDISVPLVIFGVYHTCGLIGARLLNRVRPAATQPSLLLQTGKAVLLFAFVAFSLPLLTLRLAEIGQFYSSLVGLR